MRFAVHDQHRELAQSVRSFLAKREAGRETRSLFAGGDPRPAFWPEFAATGWLSVHIPEAAGGSGYGPLEAAVIAAELGFAAAPGPFLATAVVLDALSAHPAGREIAQLPLLVAGTTSAGLGLRPANIQVQADGVHGELLVLSLAGAAIVALPAGDDLLLVDPAGPGAETRASAALDPAHAVGRLRLTAAPVLARLPAAARRATELLELLAAADACGTAAASCAMAARYACERIAFGRPIGQFQAVKHSCADMAIVQELCSAAVWEAARTSIRSGERSPAHLAALSLALDGALDNAKRAIQIHGGMGFTWECDAHLLLRRAAALRAIITDARLLPLQLARRGPIRFTTPILTETLAGSDKLRAELREFAERYRGTPEAQRVGLLGHSGLLYPHWPPPWGRNAKPAEQLVIDDELQAIARYDHLGPNQWTLPIVLPTLMAHGTADQQGRWILPTMLGELRWCQLFSEPGSGSDLASLSTRAQRAEGGWSVSGQKVWTSSAQYADVGFALVRTDPGSRRNAGITCMVIDMHAAGVTVRPLEQITGEFEFNEVFFDDVFVPDVDVVGQVDGGWKVARTTLGNERISLMSMEHVKLWRSVERLVGEAQDPVAAVALGRLAAVQYGLIALQARTALRAVLGEDLGVDGNIGKLVGGEMAQRLADLGQDLLGAAGLEFHSDDPVGHAFLQTRALTIAGGTSEIIRNVVAEQALGLPRDPRPSDN